MLPFFMSYFIGSSATPVSPVSQWACFCAMPSIQLIFGVHLVARGGDEVYEYDGCIEQATRDPTVAIKQPDCVSHYALCKLKACADENGQENLKIRWCIYEIRNTELIYCIIALYLTGNDWSAGLPRPY